MRKLINSKCSEETYKNILVNYFYRKEHKDSRRVYYHLSTQSFVNFVFLLRLAYLKTLCSLRLISCYKPQSCHPDAGRVSTSDSTKIMGFLENIASSVLYRSCLRSSKLKILMNSIIQNFAFSVVFFFLTQVLELIQENYIPHNQKEQKQEKL
jgi:hypothetical protein